MTKTSTRRDASGNQDALTAARIAAILESPNVPELIKGELVDHIGQLNTWTSAAPDTCEPRVAASLFLASAAAMRESRPGDFHYDNAAPVYATITAIAEQRDPREYRIARRLAEIVAEPGAETGDIAEAIVALTEEAAVNITHPDLIGPTFLVLHAKAESMIQNPPKDLPLRGRPDRLREWIDTLARLAGVE